jgi:hypothetical protein
MVRKGRQGFSPTNGTNQPVMGKARPNILYVSAQ